MRKHEVRVAVIDETKAFADLLASPFEKRGIATLQECHPIDFERLVQFCPSVIVLGMGRREVAYDRPIESEEDISGYQALAEIESYPAVHTVPILIVGSGLQERDIPTRLNYDLFLTSPSELDLYYQKVQELGSERKSRRKISRYVCPACKGRLTYTLTEEDLFCPRCGTAVAIINQTDSCIYSRPGGVNQTCSVAELKPPAVEG